MRKPRRAPLGGLPFELITRQAQALGLQPYQVVAALEWLKLDAETPRSRRGVIEFTQEPRNLTPPWRRD